MTTPERARLERFLDQKIEDHFRETRMQEHEESALKAVTEALMWACLLDETLEKQNPSAYPKFRDNDRAADVVRGVRYARNRAVHQAAEFLKLTGGAAMPHPFPAPLFEFIWRPVAELPPADPGKDSPKQRASYEKALVGIPVRFTLLALQDFFKRAP
jgi:hypothetical protein